MPNISAARLFTAATRVCLLLLVLALLAGQAAAQSYWSSSGQDIIGIGNNCQNISNLTVSLYVTQDMLAATSGGDLNGTTVANGGFSLQLNATPNLSTNPAVYWLQYLIVIQNNQAFPFVQYFDNTCPGGWGCVNNPGHPAILSLPSNMIPAGYVLTIALTTNPNTGNVTGASFSVTDNAGNIHTISMPSAALPMPTYVANNTTILSPFGEIGLQVLGPPTDETSTFSSGAGYLTYGISKGQLMSLQGSPCGVNITAEQSNASYGITSPSSGSTLVQPLTTSFAGSLASNMDTADNVVQVYHFTEVSGQTGNFYLNQFAFNGNWSATNVTTTAGAPAATLGSPVLTYENTLSNASEAFYFVPLSQGGQQVEQLLGKTWSPNSLTTLANAQPAALGSGLVGYIDPIAATDNVFYQGTDQHVHLLTWSQGGQWAEDTRIGKANAPVATFASALTGHMNAQSEEVFYIGTNQHIYELWRWSKNFDGWHSTDITQANGLKPLPAIGSQLVGFYDARAGTDAIFYVGTDQHVHELLFSANTWTGLDLTPAPQAAPGPVSGVIAALNAPVLGSALAAHLNTIANSEEVFFIDGAQTIEEVWSWSTATPTWNRADLFQGIVPYPVLATPGSPLATDINSVSSTTTDELYYVGTDGNVHVLSWAPNTGKWSVSVP